MRALGILLATLIAAEAAAAQSVVPTRAIRAQTVIAASDLVLAEDAVPGALAALEEAVGREAKVTLYPNRPIMPHQIGAPAVVERNQLVRMIYAEGSLSISVEGRVLDRAGPGELVRVMNLGSRQIVTGLVSDSGIIEVGK